MVGGVVGGALGCAGCGGAPVATPADLGVPLDLAPAPLPFCDDRADGGPPATLALIEQVLEAGCTSSGCHGAAFPAVPGLDLRPGQVIASTVGRAATAACGGVRVTAGDPARSFLYRKLADEAPCDGLRMPRC